MGIINRPFGNYQGKEVVLSTLFGDNDNYISIMNWGAAIQNWVVKSSDGELTSVVLGFKQFDYYPKYSPFFGAIIGRVANRIANGKFSLNGKKYNLDKNKPPNHLHGGKTGFGRSIWDYQIDENSNSIKYLIKSSDGHEGYPGNVEATVKYSLNKDKLTIEMEATSDQETPINMAQHNYFNLCSSKNSLSNYNICEHVLYLNSFYYTETNKFLIPSGKICKINNTNMDFSVPKKIGNLALDDNFVLYSERELNDPVAKLSNDESGIELKLWTDQPGLQVYNSPKLKIKQPGLNNIQYGPFSGICLEAQKFPDSLNQKSFPSILITEEKPYYQKTQISIACQ